MKRTTSKGTPVTVMAEDLEALITAAARLQLKVGDMLDAAGHDPATGKVTELPPNVISLEERRRRRNAS